MYYQFPIINDINDVLPIIKDIPEISIIDKGDYKVIAYRINDGKLFSNENNNYEIIRECRGLIFNQSGKIISRPYHKFFNCNECTETFINNIDVSVPHIILEKIDGSMITPIEINGKIRLCTKRGITDISIQAEEFIKNKEDYYSLIDYSILNDITLIFEWTSNQNRIIIDYNDNLILTGARHNINGSYASYEVLTGLGNMFNIPIVKAYSGTINSMNELVENTKNMTDIEGYVLRFHNGHMVKIKCDWYVTLHKTKDVIKYEKDIIKLILTESLDDLKPFLLENDLKKVNKFEKEFVNGFNETLKKVKDWSNDYLHLNRKEFSEKTKEIGNLNCLAFGLYDNKDITEMLKNIILKKSGSQSGINSIRHLYNCEYKNETKDE